MNAPTIIEDEPPYEFYASLLGIKTSWKTSKSEIVVLPPQPPILPDEQNSRDRNVVETSSSSSCDECDDGIPSIREGNHDKRPACSVYERAFLHPMALSSLALTSSNCKGYNLLTRMGWKEADGGLGKHRQGTLVPIRPYGNQEQRGLGFAAKRRRRDAIRRNEERPPAAAAVKTTRAQRRRLRQQQADAESQQLKRARMLLRTDVSEEYQELYAKLHSGDEEVDYWLLEAPKCGFFIRTITQRGCKMD